MSRIPEDYNRTGFYTFLGSYAFVVIFFIILVTVFPKIELGENIRTGNETEAPGEPASQVDTDNSGQGE